MARNRGFEKNGKPAKFDYERQFRREVLAAKKKAGRVVGREIVKERIEGLKAVNSDRIGGANAISRRRRQAVRSVVGRDGTLVALDHAPMAVIQETGGLIRGNGKLLRIADDRRRERGKPTFVTKKGLVFEVEPHRKRTRNADGTFRKSMKPKPKPRLVAVLKPEVAIPRLPEKARLTNIAEGKLGRYRDLIDQFLTEGFR